MATYTIQPQRLLDWMGAGNDLPPFLAGYIQDYLVTQSIDADVSVGRDGTITFDTESTQAELVAALQLMTPGDIDPDKPKQDAYQGIMAQLDAFADAVEAGTPPTAAQTQAAVARLVRVVQYVAARR
jgi:predicted dehydrogenase